MYSHISDTGQPESPRDLPQSYLNVSNFHLLPDNELAKYKYYPVLSQPKPTYNPLTHWLRYDLKFDSGTGTVAQLWRLDPIPANMSISTGDTRYSGTITIGKQRVTVENGIIKSVV